MVSKESPRPVDQGGEERRALVDVFLVDAWGLTKYDER